MRTLLDTNVLLRGSQPSSADGDLALAAVDSLIKAGRSLFISSQTIYEFLGVATKPVKENGLGLKQIDADHDLSRLVAGFQILYDSEAVASELRRLVVLHQVTGKKVHDARLVAVMNVHAIEEILTFNDADFKRFTSVRVITPPVAVAGLSPAP